MSTLLSLTFFNINVNFFYGKKWQGWRSGQEKYPVALVMPRWVQLIKV